MEEIKCILCDMDAERIETENPSGYRYVCRNCGEFLVSDEFADCDKDIHSKINKPLLSGYVREQNELGKKDVFISNQNVFNLLKSPLIPQTIGQKIEKFILFLDRRTKYYSYLVLYQQVFVSALFSGFEYDENQIHYSNPERVEKNILQYDISQRVSELDELPAIAYAYNIDEMNAIIEYCVKKEYIDNPNDVHGLSLTMSGVEYAQSLKKRASDSNTAFVAMWFDEKGEMREVYDKAIKPAIESEQCGYFKAFRVDDQEFNGDVTDKIIAEIKRSRFVVADLTGYRGGVYYEAGYGLGLGKEVILTCHKDWYNGDNGKPKVHFDVNHLNTIVWSTPEELKERLIERIRATIG